MSTYDVILLDPPWSYTGQQDKWGAAAKFYPLMSNREVYDLQLPLNTPGVVFLWATCPKLHIAMRALREWKLYFRGVAFVWVKTTQNGTPIGAQGVRPSIIKPLTELVLVASNIKEGRPLQVHNESVPQTIFEPRKAHSEKPGAIQRQIELLYPQATKLEMFARKRRDKWDSHGDQL